MRSSMPVIGEWYRGLDGAMMEVVAIDVSEGSIEVQHFDGTVEEFDMEGWQERGLITTKAPEDWSGSVDMEPEDFDNAGEEPNAPTWADPLNFLDRNEASGYSEWPVPTGERLY
jgi:predicted dehydrogenase